MLDVFVSHSTKNKNIANAVVNRLETEGIKCFTAPRDMEAGADYSETIVNAIKQSKITMLIFSAMLMCHRMFYGKSMRRC